MSRRTFDIIEEPQGAVWRRVLHALASQSASILLVLRDGLGMSDGARAFIARLQPHLISESRGSSWPGTALLGGAATLLRFKSTAYVVDELLAASDELYAWRQPMLPEDLALLREDGSTLLGSIAHERDAFLELTDEEFDALRVAVPEVESIVRTPE